MAIKQEYYGGTTINGQICESVKTMNMLFYENKNLIDLFGSSVSEIDFIVTKGTVAIPVFSKSLNMHITKDILISYITSINHFYNMLVNMGQILIIKPIIFTHIMPRSSVIDYAKRSGITILQNFNTSQLISDIINFITMNIV